MMIAVLIDSIKPGSSGWVAVRHTRKIKVRGMEKGSCAQIELKGNGHDGVIFQAMSDDCDFDIPDGADSVRAEIVKIGEGSRISVDLE